MTRKEIFLAAFQNRLSKSRIITALAIKVRNQCNRIIIERFGIKHMSPGLNGEHLLLDHIIPICNSYFDIGANKGDWTAYILDKIKSDSFELYLYEPGLVAFNISLKRFKEFNNIHITNTALSDSIGTIDLFEQENAGELSSAIQKWAYGPISKIEVKTTTIDSELSRLKIDYLDYIKIDTEGFDLKVLKGAINSIINNKIGFIQFEYNTAWSVLGSTLLEAHEILEGNGYKVFLIQPNGLYSYNVRKNGEFYAFSNFIAIAPSNLMHLKKIIKGAA
jgi:FkbM family methyltransferase